MGEILHRCILPLELTNSNDGRGFGWHRSAARRKHYERKLDACGFMRSPFPVPVDVSVTRILGKGQKLWDASSGLRGNWKEIEDSLVALGWFHGDGPAFIRNCDFRQDSFRRYEGPSIEITIRGAT